MGDPCTWSRLLVGAAAVSGAVASWGCGPPPKLRLMDGSGGWSAPSVGAGGATSLPDQALPACTLEGDPCEQDAECCSGQCLGGVCAAECSPYAPCAQDTDCCSGEVCGTDAQGDTYCQSEPLGAPSCGTSGSVCTTDADCCSGACDPTQLLCF